MTRPEPSPPIFVQLFWTTGVAHGHEIIRPLRLIVSSESGGDLVSTWVAKQCRACQGRVTLLNSSKFIHANDERYALAAKHRLDAALIC